MSKRYVLEGVWSGYHSGQERVCHREIVTGRRAKTLQGLHTVEFTDFTKLYLKLRPALPREQVKEIRGYDRLIRQCEALGKSFVKVADLPSD